MRLLNGIARLIYQFRDILWKYPDILFFGKISLWVYAKNWYVKTRPFSHFALSGLTFVLIVAILTINTNALLNIKTNQFIEGVVVGLDENGNLKGIERVNPLIPSNAQIEKDVASLIYEELLRVNQNGEVELVLLDSFGEIKSGNHYRFKLKNNIYWHDGRKFTTNDVSETINLLSRLHRNNETASNYSAVVANQLDKIRIIDDYTFELKLKSPEAVLPTFLEAISFKILPAEYIRDLDDISVFAKDRQFNKYPVGTGKYVFESATKNTVNLVRNDKYYGNLPHIKQFKFKLFPDEESAYVALATSNIHALGGISTTYIAKSENLRNYNLYNSNVIYNQYWALYFNLNDNAGLEMLKFQQVRQAINLGINKKAIIDEILGLGEEAYSTIPRNSFVFADDYNWIEYNPEEAARLLEEAGWELDESDGYRKKNEELLEFEMILVDNPDRIKVANVIQANLKEIGIKVNLKIETLNTVVDKYILPKHFDTLLYGQTTFIDPDRFELFHSSQRGNVLLDGAAGSENTGLNISGFKSSEQGRRIVDKEVVNIPKADILLESGRQFLTKENRIKIYRDFQQILAEEVPVIFLYNPVYPYIVNQRIKNVKIDSMVNLEDRFRNISDWEIEI